ncbi:CU044_2847 family protein [Streptomyces sp. NPDC014724]|uniref:CU044_2847 family protein n=1 Tax=unclassified Streptomyces TaxID=2593676 RepID=UPI0036FB6BB1
MGDSEARITRIEMPDGTPVWARISGAEELAEPVRGPAFTDIGYGDFAERVQARVESLQAVVTSVARSLAEPLRAVRPDEVSVEFGIELTAKAGKVVGLLADGEAKGGIKVTLTWNGGGPPVDPPIPAQSGARAAGQTTTPPPRQAAPHPAPGEHTTPHPTPGAHTTPHPTPGAQAASYGPPRPQPVPPMPPPPSSPPGQPPVPAAPPAATPDPGASPAPPDTGVPAATPDDGASAGTPDADSLARTPGAGASTGAAAHPDGAGPGTGSHS